MLLPKNTPTQLIEIWQPRWKDHVVLIAKFKVGMHNTVRFTKTPSMPDDYYVSGAKVTQYPLETNGKILCYAVPLSELELLQRED